MIDAPENTLSPAPGRQKQKRRRLTLLDVEAIADLVSRQKLNEREACAVLGIRAGQWYNFKARGKRTERFENICTRIRGAAISHAMSRIEKAGEKDWRADHARLQLLAPERFGQQAQQQSGPQTQVLVTFGGESGLANFIARTIGATQAQAALPPAKELKESSREPQQLPEAG